jgi:group I intron endonuclease
MRSGVYQITTPAGRRYVGSARDFPVRFSSHRVKLKARTHPNKILQAAWDKYGDSLKWEPIIYCAKDQVLLYEQIALDALSPEMNVLRVAGSSVGYRHTPETLEKFKARRQREYTPEQRALQSQKMRRPLSPEKYAALCERAARRRGTPMSEEQKEKLRAANIGKKYGPMSDEHKAKIGAANKARMLEKKRVRDQLA